LSNSVGSHVRYLLAQTITAGEFSADVEGLRANAPGDKSKVFGMQEGLNDFITNRYRVDIQYRGTTGAPPNAITWHVQPCPPCPPRLRDVPFAVSPPTAPRAI
jgi:hypothetical protein